MNTQAEVEEPWEALDLDESELSSFLRPCKRKAFSCSVQTPTLPLQTSTLPQSFNRTTNHHQILQRCSSSNQFLKDNCSYSLIPGPAGIVQSAMRRKVEKDPRSFNEHGEPIPTQEFIRRAAEEPDWEDKDFSDGPWLSAVDYIRSEGLLGNSGNAIGTPVSEIKISYGSWGKVEQVVAIIKTCTPNGLGDVMLTLKDPTGTIDGSVHKKVFAESEFGRNIRVGAVMILTKVAVCTPSGSSRYLNITLKNISKVITKDTPDLSQHNNLETSVQIPGTVIDNERHLPVQPNVFPVEQGITEENMNNLRQNAHECSEVVHTDIEMGETNLAEEDSNIDPKDVTDNQRELGAEQDLLEKHDLISQTKSVACGTTSNTQTQHWNQRQQLHEDVTNQTDTANYFGPVKQLDRNRESHSSQQENAIGNCDEVATQTKVQKSQPLASTSTVPQWTDEQLEELFAFD